MEEMQRCTMAFEQQSLSYGWIKLEKIDNRLHARQMRLYTAEAFKCQIEFYLALFVATINIRKRLYYENCGKIVNHMINFYYFHDQRIL